MYTKNSLLQPEACDILSPEEVSALNERIRDMKIDALEKKYNEKIKHLPDGRWTIRFGGRGSKQIFRKTKEELLTAILAYEESEKTPAETLKTLSKKFFEYRFPTTSGGTYSDDVYYYKHFIEPADISNIPLKKLSYEDGLKWVSWLMEQKSTMTKKYFLNVRGTLNQMLDFAISLGLILSNPVANVNIHRDHLAPKKRVPETDLFFSDEEYEAVRQIAYSEAEHLASALPLFVPILYNIGIRDAELCALKWRDIEDSYIHIQAEMVAIADKDGKIIGFMYVSHTKSSAGDRRIPINPEVREIIKMIKKYNLANGFGISQDDFVFQRVYKKEKTFCTTRCFETRIKRYCREAGMKVLKSQHDMRRTFATTLFANGIDVKEIQEWMGHESIEQTYAYIMHRRSGASLDVLSKPIAPPATTLMIAQ